jgi:serine/threonine protein kinase
MDLTRGPDDTAYTPTDTTSNNLSQGVIIRNRYLLLEKLGRGTQGEVWKAFDSKVSMHFALKFLLDKTIDSPRNQADLVKSFQLCSTLNHRGLCKLYHLEDEPGYGPYLVMEYIEGIQLHKYRPMLLKKLDGENNTNTPQILTLLRKAIPLLRPVAEGLDELHSSLNCPGEMLLHRDVKSSNILVEFATESCKLIDFGIAEAIQTDVLGEQPTRGSNLNGTLPYLAPETIRNQLPDDRSDQYALAVVIYEFLCGKRPFENEDEKELKHAILHSSPPKLPALNDHSMAVISRALSKSPNERYSSCSEFLGELAKTIHIEENRDISPKKHFSSILEFLEEEHNLSEQLTTCQLKLQDYNRKLERLSNPIRISVLGVENSGKSSLLWAWYHNRAKPPISLRITDPTTLSYFRDLDAQLVSNGIIAPTYIKPPEQLILQSTFLREKPDSHERIDFDFCVQDYAGELLRKQPNEGEEATAEFAQSVQQALRKSNVVLCLVDVTVEDDDLSNIFDQLLHDGEIDVVILVITKFDAVLDWLGETKYPTSIGELRILVQKIARLSPRFGILWNQIQALESDTQKSRMIIPVAALGVELYKRTNESNFRPSQLMPFQPLHPLAASAQILIEKRIRILTERSNAIKEQNRLRNNLQVLRDIQDREVTRIEATLLPIKDNAQILLDQLDTDIPELKKLARNCGRQLDLCKQWKLNSLAKEFGKQLAIIQEALHIGASFGRARRLRDIRSRLDSTRLHTLSSLVSLVSFISETFNASVDPALATLPEGCNDQLKKEYRTLQIRVFGRCFAIVGTSLTILAVVIAGIIMQFSNS